MVRRLGASEAASIDYRLEENRVLREQLGNVAHHRDPGSRSSSTPLEPAKVHICPRPISGGM